MGQYYRPVLMTEDEIIVFNRNVDGEYTLAKLMEHSWWRNPMVSAICKQITDRGKVKVTWVGDYADPQVPGMPTTTEEVWNTEGEGLPPEFVYLDGKYLVNHSKKLFLNCDSYYNDTADCEFSRNKGWVIHPLPLLTAWGNDRGGGDFHRGNVLMPNIGYDDVGKWAGDVISIETSPPEGFIESNVRFIER